MLDLSSPWVGLTTLTTPPPLATGLVKDLQEYLRSKLQLK